MAMELSGLLVGWAESDLTSLRLRLWRWIQDVHDPLENLYDGRFVEVETAFEFLLQLCELAGC